MKGIGKIRPQVALAILCATVFSLFTVWVGYKLGAVEVITAVIGGVFGLYAGVSLKILENELCSITWSRLGGLWMGIPWM